MKMGKLLSRSKRPYYFYTGGHRIEVRSASDQRRIARADRLDKLRQALGCGFRK